MSDETGAPKPNPHWIWWLGHIVLGIITGLVVYVLYKDKNYAAARKHLIFSIIIWVVGTAASFVTMLLLGLLFPWGDNAYPDSFAILASMPW